MSILLNEHPSIRIRSALARSEFLRCVASVRRDGGHALAFRGTGLRPLSPRERGRLQRQGNVADDWSRVLVAEGFDAARARNCQFRGDVSLGRFTGHLRVGGLDLPSGVHGSTLADCVVGHDALVYDVKLLARYVVGPGAVLLDCGRVTCDPATTFGNGCVLPVGIEVGGRPVQVYAEMDVETAAFVARAAGRPGLLAGYAAAVAEYLRAATADRGIVERGAQVLNTPRVHNVYVGPAARVDGATAVADSTLLSSEEEPVEVASGACVSESLLQWGSSVKTMAVVERALLTEHAHVERHGKVIDSILGPNTAVGAGEVTSCLLGPFVAAHHQSLLIATVWPEGKGNVGYGANVGSNHTSRAPDQEFLAGEGMFFGLGVNVKFPSDFSRAPYTVVACGASLLPQRCTFPFSLIAPPSAQPPGLSPAYMEISPAWALAENLYGLKRNEAKYRSRNKARRCRFEFAVLRPDTVELMRDAAGRLAAVGRPKEFYTEAEVEGLGKNFLTEKGRLRALEAYRFFVRYYALLGLKGRAEEALAAGDAEACRGLLASPGDDPRWEHQRQLLAGELGITGVIEGLQELPAMLEKTARDVEESKARDDRRGARILDDYAEVHAPAAQDEWVRRAWEEARRLQAEVGALLLRWRAEVSPAPDAAGPRDFPDPPTGRPYLPGPGVPQGAAVA